MASTAMKRATNGCPGHPEGVHGWAIFPGGRGCLYCDAWIPYGRPAVTVDPHPTGLISLAAFADAR